MLLRSKELNLEFKALSKYLKIYDTRERHSQLFEAGLHLKRNVSENVFITSWSLPRFANDNGFAYFCRMRNIFRKVGRTEGYSESLNVIGKTPLNHFNL